MNGKDSLRETMEQPGEWAEVIEIAGRLEADLKSAMAQADGVILTGCGSALNISFAGAPTLQRHIGTDARAIPAADIFQFPEACFPRGRRPLVISISRSGETSETVLAQRTAGKQGCRTVSLTCFESTMSREADVAILLPCCQEKSVCTTKSVSGMVLALQLMASINDAALRQELSRLPEVGERLIDRAVSLGESLGNDIGIRKYAFIGSGPLYGIARECQLKVKEMTLLPSDCYPLMDYRHGPKSNVDESMLVTMLCSDSGRKWEQECAEELKKHGGQLLLMSDSPVGVSDTNSFYFESGLSEYARAILYLPVIQAMATYRALSLGMDPDNPKNLSYWVKTNSLDTPDDKTDPEPLTTGRQGK